MALRHLSHTFRLVNQRLAGEDAVSDKTIAVVVMMSQYERLQDRYHDGIVHVAGLQKMTELRGGICRLAVDQPALAQKILR